MRNLQYALALLASVFALAACGETVVKTGVPDPRAEPNALSLEACPEGSNSSTVEIGNIGRAVLNAKLELAGPGADMFSLDTYELNLPIGASKALTVTYHPTAGGAGEIKGEQHSASIQIKYVAAGKTEIKSVQLVGDVSNAESAPTPSIECAPGVPVCVAGEEGKRCCRAAKDEGSPVTYITMLDLGGVPFGETSELPVVIKNLGCDPLPVESATIEFTNNTCEPGELVLAAPTSISGRGSESMKLTFAPSAERPNSCEFLGSVQLAWGAEVDKTRITTRGRAVAPALNIAPGPVWNFREDILPGATETREFRVWNSGTEDIEISSVAFEGDNKSEFKVLGYRRCDDAPVGGPPFVLEAGAAASACGPHEIKVNVEYAPTAPPHRANAMFVVQSTGGSRASVMLTGGKPPEMYSFPSDTLSFASPRMGACTGSTGGAIDAFSCAESNGCPGPCTGDGQCGSGKCLIPDGATEGFCENDDACAITCGGATRVARFCNRSTSPLKFRGFEIVNSARGLAPKDQLTGLDIFYVEPGADACTGKSLEQGVCCDVEITFRDSVTGGVTAGMLLAHTDDPKHPTGYELILTSMTDTNRPPLNIVDITPPAPMLPAGSAPGTGIWVRLDPSNSTDDRGIAGFQWTLDSVSDSLSKLLPGVIEPGNETARCKDGFQPPEGGPCIKLQANGVLDVYADRAASFQFKLKSTDVACGHTSETIHRFTVTREKVDP